MSTDFTAQLVVGVLAKKYTTNKTTKTTVTKYNQDTGQPYEKVLTTTKIYLLDKEVQDHDWNEAAQSIHEDLNCYYSYYYHDSNDAILGISIGAAEPTEDTPISWAELAVAKDKMEQIIKDHTPEELKQQPSVQLYLMCCVS